MPEKNEETEELTENENKKLDFLLQKLFEERGMDFREYKKASLKRRIQKRLEANRLTSYEEYMKLLDATPDEYTKLFDALLINVTEFFRDPEAFQVLEKKILPEIISKKKKGDPIRIWSSGCASGEEPYSVGILLAEKLGRSIQDYEIKIYATDIDENTLIEARKGVYSENRLKNVKPGYIEKYFTRENGGYRINRNIRQIVIFGRQSLTSDPPISHLDLILCRNVLIYFNLELQNKLMIKFHYALDRDGYIFFGKSESMLVGSKLFNPISTKWRFFQKSAGAGFTAMEGRGEIMDQKLIDIAMKESKRELKSMEFYNQTIIQNISPGLIVIDNNNLLTTWNKAMEDLWLIRAENAVGRDFFELGMGERLPGIKEQIDEIKRKKKNIRVEALEVTDYRGGKRFLDLTLVPLIDPNSEFQGIIIIINDVTEDKKLRDDLKKSNEDLQMANEKLETTNEELVSANEELETTTEELQSTAEELETSNEELQSTNEELETTNEELRSSNEELETTNDELKDRTEQLDLINTYNKAIIQSMNQSLVVLSKNGTVTTWNPAAEEMFGIKEEDAIGSSFFALKTDPCFMTGELMPQIRQVIESRKNYHERTLECSTSSGEKLFLVFTIVPLIDITGESKGTMLISRDVTEEKRAEEAVQEGIVETAHEPLMILNGKLKVKKANQAFYRTFNVSQEETENRFIYDLGNRQWDIPRLRELLEEIIPLTTVIEDFEVEHEFPVIGKKKMLLNAHRIYRKDSTEMILLAIEDVTER